MQSRDLSETAVAAKYFIASQTRERNPGPVSFDRTRYDIRIQAVNGWLIDGFPETFDFTLQFSQTKRTMAPAFTL